MSIALLVEMDTHGGILLRPAMVLPVEIYSEKRLKEFARENAMTEAERRRVTKMLHGKADILVMGDRMHFGRNLSSH